MGHWCVYGDVCPFTSMLNSIFTGKERRESGGFIGFENVQKHLKDGPPRRRVGLVVEGAPARGTSRTRFFFPSLTIYLEGASIVAEDKKIGLYLFSRRCMFPANVTFTLNQAPSLPAFPRQPSARTSRWVTCSLAGTRRAQRSKSTYAISYARRLLRHCRSSSRGSTGDKVGRVVCSYRLRCAISRSSSRSSTCRPGLHCRIGYLVWPKVFSSFNMDVVKKYFCMGIYCFRLYDSVW